MIIPVTSLANDLNHRVTEFYRNCYTGKTMQQGEWFTKQMIDSRSYRQFGGLENLIKFSSSEASREGGLKSIRVLKNESDGTRRLIEVEVIFNSLRKAINRDYWINDKNKWKITSRKEEKDTFAP